MRIAYIALYQGPGLVMRRPCLHNLSLANKIKIEMIAELLHRNSHEVEIMSQGAVDRYEFRFHGGFEERERFHPAVAVYYASAFPVRFMCGFWASHSVCSLLRARYRAAPFDLVIIHNMKRAHLACARYATQRLGLPVILEYEDDSFVDVAGEKAKGLIARYHRYECREALKKMSGCIGVSPYLLCQLPSSIPKLLLRAVLSYELLNSKVEPVDSRKNWVVFSGTHEGTQGLEQMINAWQTLGLPDWELHIAGRGSITAKLVKMAEKNRSIVFHGFLNKEENARMLCSAKIGMNPQDVTKVPGNVFAFKIIEYLAAGLHVITTPRGALEPELEAGISYIADNTPATIAAAIRRVISNRGYEQTAEQAALQMYGPVAVSNVLNRLIEQVAAGGGRQCGLPADRPLGVR